MPTYPIQCVKPIHSGCTSNSDCSDHGVCNAQNQCQCNTNYFGPQCSQCTVIYGSFYQITPNLCLVKSLCLGYDVHLLSYIFIYLAYVEQFVLRLSHVLVKVYVPTRVYVSVRHHILESHVRKVFIIHWLINTPCRSRFIAHILQRAAWIWRHLILLIWVRSWCLKIAFKFDFVLVLKFVCKLKTAFKFDVVLVLKFSSIRISVRLTRCHGARISQNAIYFKPARYCSI